MKLLSRHNLALASGIILFLVIIFFNPFSVSPNAAKVLAVAALMITWWVAEAMPMPVVALLPLILFPLMGVAKMEETAAPYANPIIFLFMGGFMIGLAIEKWELHKRIALNIVRITGTSGNKIILGFILATGFLSMWLSNTATTMMMFPIAMSVISVLEKTHHHEKGIKNIGICLMLSIAYSSNFGGIATIIGTPPNVAYVAFLEKRYHYSFSFSDWMIICAPIAFLLMFTLYFVMTRILYPNRIKKDEVTTGVINDELYKLGKITSPEKRVLIIFALTAFLWIFKDLINGQQKIFKLDDTMIAILGAVLLFITPSNSLKPETKFLLEWHDTQKMAWGILLLFGGGITLANQLEKAGLIQQLGSFIAHYAGSNLFLLVFLTTLISIFISEIMSNIAQVIVFSPVIAGIADALHIDPLLLGIPLTLGASCASMLPMGTPPNAIVFASNKLKLKDMITTGFVMNMVATVLITLFSYFLIPVLIKWVAH
jgi:sodium-dependent dicarboxylate transporter 2/3/5